jgi:hypothetical protein
MAPHGFAFVPRTFLDVESLQAHLTATSQTNKDGDGRYFFKKALESRGTGVFPFYELSEIPNDDLMDQGVFQVRWRPPQTLPPRRGSVQSSAVRLRSLILSPSAASARPAEALQPYKRHSRPEDDDFAWGAVPQAG